MSTNTPPPPRSSTERHGTPIAVRAVTAAQMLDCSRQHIYELCGRGKLRRLQIDGSRSTRIPVEDIYAVLGLEQPHDGGDAA